MTRSIKKHVQLIKQDNGCFLMSRSAFRDSLDVTFSLSEFTKDPLKNIYITKKLQALSFPGDRPKYKLKQIIPYIQKINFAYIKKNGKANFEGARFPDKLYVDFLKLEKKADLVNFLKSMPDFCIFPTDAEIKKLSKKYKNVVLKGAPEYPAIFGEIPDELRKELDGVFGEIIKEIVKINLDFIWEKQQELKNFVSNYLDDKKTEDDLLWLLKPLENVTTNFTNNNSFLWQSVRDAKLIEKEKWSDEEIFGMKNAKKVEPIEAYRIYGHFALCCLEVFLDMEESLPFYLCTKCGQLNQREDGSKRKTCPDSNEFCRLRRLRARKSISNKWKKIKQKEKSVKNLKDLKN